MTACCGGNCTSPHTCGCGTSTGQPCCRQAGCSTNAAKRAEDRREFLGRVLGDLTDRQRFVVECYYGMRGDPDGYTVREIADLMDVHHSTVEEHLRAAMKKLQKHPAKTAIEGGLFSPATTVDEDDGEDELCASPFTPHLSGLPPTAGWDLISEWDDDLDRPRLADGFSIGRLNEL